MCQARALPPTASGEQHREHGSQEPTKCQLLQRQETPPLARLWSVLLGHGHHRSSLSAPDSTSPSGGPDGEGREFPKHPEHPEASLVGGEQNVPQLGDAELGSSGREEGSVGARRTSMAACRVTGLEPSQDGKDSPTIKTRLSAAAARPSI